VLRSVFGHPVPAGSTGDLNADGAVDVLDLALLASNWGRQE
jgi:hypothetical protein